MTQLAPKSVAAILPAAGKSSRFEGEDKKIFALLANKPVWWHAASRLRSMPQVGQVIIAVASEDLQRWQTDFALDLQELSVEIVTGGSERHDSVLCAIKAVKDASHIAVHDAARPLVSEADLASLFQSAEKHNAAILASPLRGTLKRAEADQTIKTTVDRRDLWEAHTPQLFRREVIENAYVRWRGYPVTDDASLVERAGDEVCLVPGSPLNIKITTAEDLRLAEAILAMSRTDI